MLALRTGLLTVTLLLCAGVSEAFNTTPFRWPHGVFEMEADIEHPIDGFTSPSGTSWNTAFADAAAEWNSRVGGLAQITINTGVYEDPCSETLFVHGVDFTTEVCDLGMFGKMTLAVAVKGTLGGDGITKAYIVFNEAIEFDVFTGPTPLSGSPQDFKRVAVHELGHVLGLDHEDVNPAIMDPFAGDIEVPQADDLNGISAIYDLGCPLYSSSTGALINGELVGTDCFDTESGLPISSVPGQSPRPDVSVDIYPVTADGSLLSFELISDQFNPALMLVDESLTTEIQSAFGLTTNLNVTPPPGEYALVVRTLIEGEGGTYTLTGVPEPTHAALSTVALATLAGLARARRGRFPTEIE